MKLNPKKIIFSTLKIGGIVIAACIALLFLLPILFPQTVTQKIKQWANGSINGSLTFSGTGLSFFKHFPALTLTLYDVNLKGSAPFANDTLVAAKEIALGIDLGSVFKNKVTIDKIFLTNAFINIQADKTGHNNYSVFKASNAANTPAYTSASGASLGIKKILIEKSRLVYNDRSIPVRINARGVDYVGSGDLSKAIFDLKTHADIQSFDFSFNNQTYVYHKHISGDLITKINTKSLEFVFQKNNVNINELPVEFTGNFAFIKDGYDMDFRIKSYQKDLSDIFTAIPSQYQKLVANTDVDGTGDFELNLKGPYVVEKNLMPDLNMSFKIRDGYIANQKTPSPIKHLFLNFYADVPRLNPDSLKLNIDSLHFNIDNDYFNAVLRVKGIKEPEVHARLNTEIDLEKWNKALGVKPFFVKGRCALHLVADGKYAKGIKKTGLRKVDTVITSIPNFSLHASLSNGYFKYASVPNAVENMGLNMDAKCTDNNVKHISLLVNDIRATALNNYIKGYFKMANTADFPIDAALQARFDLADLKHFYPIDSLGLAGVLTADMQSKGNYLPAKKKFPLTQINLSLKNGSLQTKYYPHPIQNIHIDAHIADASGSLNGLQVNIKPVSFLFEGQPFTFKAALSHFNNLEYNVTSDGTIDLGKIYQVFGLNGYHVKGLIATNLSLKGRQSDATAGHYGRLFNSGTFSVKDITLSADMFPQPFLIKSGVFAFNQDTMQFKQFTANYGRSDFMLNGSLSNVINYATKPGSVLKGDFNLSSGLLIADDFTAFAAPAPSAGAKPVTANPGNGQTGVIMVPKNLNLNFNAVVKKVMYNGLDISNAQGQMNINNGNLTISNAGFTLIDAPVKMDATYTATSAKRAYFNYHINAQNFDIKKAYTQIKLFRDMATAAAHAQGIVSLDYQLSGALNGNMQPIYPSIKGGGVLSVKQIKMFGFKMFNAIGKATNRDSISNNKDVSKVDIKTHIANNIITIDQTKMRMAGFRAKFAGQVGFDKKMNLQFRLGLPPLGLIGIPMVITGTQDKPIVRIGKEKPADQLQQTTDDGN